MNVHEKWMKYCIKLGQQALKNGNPPVGSVLIKGEKKLGQGIEAGKTHQDITYHAEIEALRDAVKNTGEKFFEEAILYTTHEPCIMCAYVIRHHRVGKVVLGLRVPEIGGMSSAYPILKATEIQIWAKPPLIIEGVLKEECQILQNKYSLQKKQKNDSTQI